MSLLLGKPMLLAVMPGVQVPDALVRAADGIIEFDPSKPVAMNAAIQEFMTTKVYPKNAG